MDFSWSELVHRAGWDFARPGSTRVLAFVYTATLSLRVEEAGAGLNPHLSLRHLARILSREPDWIQYRPQWLKTSWPDREIHTLADLEFYALTASKALLAVGSPIPDGTADEMSNALTALFPEPAACAIHSDHYAAWAGHVTIESDGRMQHSYGGPLVREGLEWPLPKQDIGNRSAFERFLFDSMRIDIQRRLEADVDQP